jgi:hypothetical protein
VAVIATDRSMPPVSMHSVCPPASSASGAVTSRVLRSWLRLRKLWSIRPFASTSATSTPISASNERSPAATRATKLASGAAPSSLIASSLTSVMATGSS